MDLKLTVDGKTITAPRPKVGHLKAYLRLLSERESKDYLQVMQDDIDFTLSLFSEDGTVQLDQYKLDMQEVMQARKDSDAWIGQHMPSKGKNGKAR